MAIKSYKSKHTGEHIELLLDNMQEIVEVKDDIVLAKDVIEDIQNLDSTIIERVANLEQRVVKIEDVSGTASMVKELEQKVDMLNTGTIQPLKTKVNEVVAKMNAIGSGYNDLEERVTVVEGKIVVFATEEDINGIIK